MRKDPIRVRGTDGQKHRVCDRIETDDHRELLEFKPLPKQVTLDLEDFNREIEKMRTKGA